MTVPLGVPVTFVLHNDDPIDHEWIVGDAAVHERHRTGTEPHPRLAPDRGLHPGRPDAGRRPSRSRRPAIAAYICHLPGHEAYGMVGVVRVGGG